MLNMKKVLILSPILFNWQEITIIKESLKFLNVIADIDYIDSTSSGKIANSAQDFFLDWRDKMMLIRDKYDIFIGFSFGGVVLQQVINILKGKKIIFISSPFKPSHQLKTRLNAIKILLQSGKIESGLTLHNSYVFAPFNPPANKIECTNCARDIDRVINGYSILLDTDSTIKLMQADTRSINLIGEKSSLVTVGDVFTNEFHTIVKIPSSGMRVLQDNPSFTHKIITDFINL